MNRFLALVAFGVLWASPAVAQDQPKDKVLNGDAQCTRCHDENDTFPVLAIGKTKHGTRADPRTPSCTSCHGASEAHMNHKSGSGAPPRPKPDVSFSSTSKTPYEGRTQVCMSCHQGTSRIDWHMSAHARTDVACSSCHVVHAARDPVRD